MKPKYIFAAVIAVCILMGSLLPRLASPGAAAASLRSAGSPPAAVPGLVADLLPTAAPPHRPAATPTVAPERLGPIPIGEPASAAAPGPAAPAGTDAGLDLAGFTAAVANGQPGAVAGVYVDGLFSLPVFQQPPGDDGYVSPDEHGVTQYAWAARYGSIGLLAHNTLSGRVFFQLKTGQEIVLVYGDGRTANYYVKEVQNYQALNPYDIHSDFVDLNGPGQALLSYEQVFQRIYTIPGRLVLQTCFEANGEPSWGRMFVLAEPQAQ